MEDQEEICESEELSLRVHKGIKNLWDLKQLCDFTIQVGQSQFHVHKLLLAACSDYFKAMLSHDSLESQQNKIVLQDIDESSMEAIIEFCYSSKIKLTIENVQEILNAASILQIKEIINLCTNYIRGRVDISNCLGVLTIADRCNLPNLVQSTMSFCLDKFDLVVKEKEFLQLDEVWLIKLIEHNQLLVNSEENVFDAIERWLMADPGTRSSKLEDLMTHVRFPLIEPVKLIELSSSNIVRKSLKCRDLIDEAKNFLMLKDHPKQKSYISGTRFQPRIPLRTQQGVYAVGGWTNDVKPIASVEKYDASADAWIEIKPMTRERCAVGVAILGDSLFAVGGHDGQNYLKSVERYGILQDTWFEDVADMKTARTSVGVVALNGYIYAIGGQMGPPTNNATWDVERYDPAKNRWEECEHMREKRLGVGITVLEGLIYVVGGADQTVLGSVECYDPARNKWNFVSSMTTKRKHLGCTSYNGKIYAVGGRDDSSEISSAECYDPGNDTWKPVPSMSERRSGIGLVELNGLIYAAGGQRGDVRLKLVEAYDPVEEQWTPKKPMIHERLGAGLAVYVPEIDR